MRNSKNVSFQPTSLEVSGPQVFCAAILAGGKSSRMGREKALLEIDGVPLIAHTAAFLRPIFPEIIVVTASPEVENAAGMPAVSDVFPGCGPLAGLHTAARHFGRPFFAVACDMPHLNADFVRFLRAELGDYEAVVPQSENGLEPLHAVYGASCEAVFRRILEEGENFSLRRAVMQLRARLVSANEAGRFGDGFFENWNSPQDVARF